MMLPNRVESHVGAIGVIHYNQGLIVIKSTSLAKFWKTMGKLIVASGIFFCVTDFLL
jgi:hypothetical protein